MENIDDSDRILNPIILAKGSHDPGTGRGCAMNVVSYVNGDIQITDLPDCSDRLLARIVQGVNDRLAGSDGLLSPKDSVVALELGFATIGTSDHGLSDLDLRRVYVRLAAHAARKVAHLTTDPRVMAAIVAAEKWADDPTAANANATARAAARAAHDAARAAHAYAADTASALAAAVAYYATTAAYAAARYAARAAHAYAADTASALAAVAAHHAARAANAAADDPRGVELARELIEMFKDLTGTHSVEPESGVVDAALSKMYEVR